MQRRLATVLLVAALLTAGAAGYRSLVPRGGVEMPHRARTTTTVGGGSAPAPRLAVTAAPWRLPEARSRAVAAPLEGRLVLFGGLAPHNVTSGAVLGIDPQSGAVAERGALIEAVHDAAVATLGSQTLVIGGGARTVSDTVQGLGVGSDALQAVALGKLPAPRADAIAAVVDGHILVAGGYDGHAASTDVLSTTDGVTFARVATLPVGVRYPAVIVQDHKLYLIGGETGGVGTAVDVVQEIDPVRHQAQVVGHLAAPLSHASAAVIDGKVYLFGGRRGGHALDVIEQLDLPGGRGREVGRLPLAASDMTTASLGDTTYLLGGEDEGGAPMDSVVIARMVAAPLATSAQHTKNGSQPFIGRLLIADRGNNRLIVVGADKQVSWTFPSAAAPAPPEGFYFPDDAFFVKHGTGIITNEEEQHTIIEIGFPSGKEVSSYGHPNKPGRQPGFLNQPDDAYLLADGRVTVADAKNCRILILNPDFTFASQIGSAGRCHHDIPRDVAYPNGDTPLSNGNLLVSEIKGSYVDEVTMAGAVVWSVHLPIAYPSDPQQIGPDLYLIADYSKPGGIYEFTRDGHITWSYRFPSGEQMLDHPSLAEMLPGGRIAVNDDYRHRVVIIDPASKQIVWQYGQTDVAGSGPNQLNTPDGFDLLARDGSTPTHPWTG